MADITITWNPAIGKGDWSVTGSQLTMGGDLDNAILISLCTDRIAEPTDVIPDSSNDPRGWWGDAYGDANYPIGSRMWLLRRAKQTQDTLQRAYDYHTEALQWLIDDGVVASFDINVQWVANGQLGATVIGYKQNGTVITQNTFTWVWNGVA
jgi:phage gp46-like protein